MDSLSVLLGFVLGVIVTMLYITLKGEKTPVLDPEQEELDKEWKNQQSGYNE